MVYYMRAKVILAFTLSTFISGVVLAVMSYIPTYEGIENKVLIYDNFELDPRETRRQGLGALRGGDRVNLLIWELKNSSAYYSVVAYGRTVYAHEFVGYDRYVLTADFDYYEVIFYNHKSTPRNITLFTSLERREGHYTNSWLDIPAKLLFFAGWMLTIVVLVWWIVKKPSKSLVNRHNRLASMGISEKKLKVLLVTSAIFWLVLLAMPGYSFWGLENWYTDHARHPYSAYLFTKYRFSVFGTPLGELANIDGSFYKFVTWTEMPHLYPIGSIFSFLPFGLLLQSGISFVLVFKMEMALFLVFAHICLYYFAKHFFVNPSTTLVKWLGLYCFYFLVVLYSANGMFDAIPLFFSLISMVEFVKNRYSKSLIYATVATSFKYQAGVVLAPLMMLALIRLYRNTDLHNTAKKIALPFILILVSVDAYTAYLNVPYMMSIRPEFIMNAVYVFSPHAQLPWQTQFFAIFFTLAFTITVALYSLHKGRPIGSLLLVYTFFPLFTMPLFQPWYLLYFYVYALIPERKSLVNVMVLWLVAIGLIISLGNVRYDLFWMVELIRRTLRR